MYPARIKITTLALIYSNTSQTVENHLGIFLEKCPESIRCFQVQTRKSKKDQIFNFLKEIQFKTGK